VPSLRQQWIETHPESVNLTGIPMHREPACQVVWSREVNPPGDPISQSWFHCKVGGFVEGEWI